MTVLRSQPSFLPLSAALVRFANPTWCLPILRPVLTDSSLRLHLLFSLVREGFQWILVWPCWVFHSQCWSLMQHPVPLRRLQVICKPCHCNSNGTRHQVCFHMALRITRSKRGDPIVSTIVLQTPQPQQALFSAYSTVMFVLTEPEPP